MVTANQEIVYRVSVDNKQAIQAFDELIKKQEGVSRTTTKLHSATQSSNATLLSFNRIIQDAPFGLMAVGNNITFMAEQMSYAKSQGASFKEQIIGMGKAFAGPGGMIFLISAATSVLTYFSMNMNKGKDSVDSFTTSIDKAIKKLIDFQDPLKNLKFGLSPDQLNQLIPAIDKEIASLEKLNEQRKQSFTLSQGMTRLDARAFTNQLTDAEKERLKINEQTVEQLKGIKSEYQAQLKVAELLRNLGLEEISKDEKINKTLRERLEIIKKITGFGINRNDPVAGFNLAQGAGFSGSFGVGIDSKNSGKAGGASITEGFAEQMMFVKSQIRETASLLSSEFKSAWEDIFGEANSLFEKFMMNIASSLAELAAQNLMNGILNWILPGAGSLAAMASGSQKQPVVIKIGEREFASLVNDANKNISTYRIN